MITPTHKHAAVLDALQAVRLLPLALHFAWGDTKARYRRSVLGPFWIVLGTAIGVTGLGYLWTAILQSDPNVLIPSLTIGIVVWQLITGCIVESAGVFNRAASVIRNIRTPFLIFPIQLILRQLINFGHNFIVIAVVMLIYTQHWSYIQTLVVPGLALVLMNLLWISVIIGMLGARFRDLEPLIGAVMPMLFFLSPVIYRPEHLPLNAWVINLNPLAYFISAIRDPLQGVAPALHVYAVLVFMAVVGWAIALLLLNSKHSRVAFWV